MRRFLFLILLVGALAALHHLAPGLLGRGGQRGVTLRNSVAVGGDAPAEKHACRFWAMTGASPQSSIVYDQLVGGTHSLRALGELNPDGWGIAYYSPALAAAGLARPQLLRAGPKANHAYDTRFSDAVSEMLAIGALCGIAHVRDASPGSHLDIPDPHPFCREGVTFAHNGGLAETTLVSLLQRGDPQYLAKHPPDYQDPYVDSELFFLYVLKLRDGGIEGVDGGLRHSLADAIAEAALDIYDAGGIETAANCVATTGDTVIALRFEVTNPSRYRVRYLETPGAWTVCSEPVGTDTTGWAVVPPKSVAVFRPGGPPEITTIYPPQGPNLAVVGSAIDDDLEGGSSGNGDGGCDSGETVELAVQLRNEGNATAANVRATISLEDPYGEIVDAYEDFGDIAPGEDAWCEEDYDVVIDPACPDGHAIPITMTIESDGRPSWHEYLVLDVAAPVFEISGHVIDDASGGNGNGRLEPGESFALTTTIANRGGEGATGLDVHLEFGHEHATLVQGDASLAALPAGQEGVPSPPFEGSVGGDCPDPDAILAQTSIEADWGRTACLEFLIPIGGFFDDVELGAGNWVNCLVTPGFQNQ